jgi:hypothetical protein
MERATTAEIGNLRMSVPPLWSVRRLEDRCGRLGTGVLISNLDEADLSALHRDLGNLPPGSCTNGWDLTKVPAAFELMDVSQLSWPGKFPKTQFPVSEDFFLPSVYESDSHHGCQCSFRTNALSYRGHRFIVRIWVGDGASETDRQVIACIIASIRPNTDTRRSSDCGSGS